MVENRSSVVIGLGYVGLPLFKQIQTNGLPTVPANLKTAIANNPNEEKYLKSILDKSSQNSTTREIANDDNYELIMYQNTMYITGTIACASLIIGAIILSRN